MNNIRATQRLNELELQAGAQGSWHDEYRDSAYVYVGGLDNDLTEGDVITIMSQYGEIADINMPRSKQTGKTQGFAFLMYEDQRSTVLAVDNLNGAQVLGRTLRVDHVKKYKQMERGEDGKMKERETQSLNALPENFAQERDAGSDSDSADPDIDPDDPMAAYLLEQKREGKRKRSSRHQGETKEERRARKERKRAKKAARDLATGGRDIEARRQRSPEPTRRYREDSRDSEVDRTRYRDSREYDSRRDRDDRRRDDRDYRDRRDERDYRGRRDDTNGSSRRYEDEDRYRSRREYDR